MLWRVMMTQKVYLCWIHLHRGNDLQFQPSMKPNQPLLPTSQMEAHIISESWANSLQHSLVCSLVGVGFLPAKIFFCQTKGLNRFKPEEAKILLQDLSYWYHSLSSLSLSQDDRISVYARCCLKCMYINSSESCIREANINL